MDGDGDGLRERRPVKRQDVNSNSNGGLEPQQEKKEKTFGRTPDGTGERSTWYSGCMHNACLIAFNSSWQRPR